MFLYDESGIIGMTLEGTSAAGAYYFQRNLLGDVIGIYDTSGAKVAGYAYDAWGNCTITLNANGIATKNPIRYRGYYYDQETGLYYLNARYYSPEWRRFISPDDTAYLDPENPNGLNLYTYCNNDPVNYVDPSGRLATTFGIGAIIAIVSAAIVISGVAQLASNALAGPTGSDLWRGVAGSALGSGVNALCLCLSPLTGVALWAVSALLAAGVQTSIDTIETLIYKERASLLQIGADFFINATTTFVGNWLGASLVHINSTWFKPQHFKSVFIKPYGQYILQQTIIGAELSALVNLIKKTDWERFCKSRFASKMYDSILD